MKINSIRLENFRGFPNPETIRLDGKNLLVYGENGAGKSSLYHALQGLFALNTPAIAGHTNLFKLTADPTCLAKVTVEFDDGQPGATWAAKHPGAVDGDRRVRNAALRSAILDYRSLLQTNFVFGDKPLNWFEILHTELLAGYQPAPGQRRLYDRWNDVQKLASGKTGKQRLTQQLGIYINTACNEFTSTFRAALGALQTEVPKILDELSENSISISFPTYGGLTYYHPKACRGIRGDSYEPDITFRTLAKLDRPQLFLNEARLSQIGLAIYLGGRKAVVPSSPTDHLNLLVLDDVLVGLDHSNRIPLLELLSNQFRDWQIVLLTHDRVWFEMARLMLHKGHWTSLEMYEGTCPASGFPMPLQRPTHPNPSASALEQAKEFLKQGHLGAAANYARTAFELKLRMLCNDTHAPVAYQINPKKYSLDALQAALNDHIKKHPTDCIGWNRILKSAINYKDTVLNPHSHPMPDLVLRAEVSEAIKAIERLLSIEVTSPKDTLLVDVETILNRGAMSDEQSRSLLIMLRNIWFVALDEFCDRKSVLFPRGMRSPKATDLFSYARNQHGSDLVGPTAIPPADVPDVLKWLLKDISEADWLTVDDASARRLYRLLCPVPGKVFLDP